MGVRVLPCAPSEHDPEKWIPVFGKIMLQPKCPVRLLARIALFQSVEGGSEPPRGANHMPVCANGKRPAFEAEAGLCPSRFDSLPPVRRWAQQPGDSHKVAAAGAAPAFATILLGATRFAGFAGGLSPNARVAQRQSGRLWTGLSGFDSLREYQLPA